MELHELVAVFIKRILAKPVLERLERAGNFFEVFDRGFFLMRQDPVVNIQHAAFALVLLREVHVVGDVDVDSVVIDRVRDFPVIRFLFTGNVVVSLFQAAVGDGD